MLVVRIFAVYLYYQIKITTDKRYITMTIIFTDIQKDKARKRANRDADITFGLGSRTRTAVYKNKKAYDRKSYKKVTF